MAPIDKARAGAGKKEEDRPSGSNFERHFQSFVLTLCAGGIGAMVTIGHGMSQSLIAQAQDLKSIQSQLDRLDARFAEYIPRSEADIRFRAIEQRESDHARRIDRLEDLRRPQQ